MYAREIASQPSPADRRERRHTFITSDPFDENFFRLRGFRHRYFEQSAECHFLVNDVDLEAWRPARKRFLRDVAAASERT